MNKKKNALGNTELAPCGHSECPPEYCLIRFYYKEHCKMNDIFNLVGSKHKLWKNGSHLPEKKVLYFSGVSLSLLPNGTYYLEDTTGG